MTPVYPAAPPASPPPHSRIGIVGGGFGALMTLAVLRFRGVPLRDILVFSPDDSPEKTWENFIRRIRLTHMRSETFGHFFPTDSPGLATVEAIKTWSPLPILKMWFDAYHPTVDFFLDHTRRIARQVGFYQAVVPAKVARITKTKRHFTLIGASGHTLGTCQHLVVAIGHGPVGIPPALAAWQRHYPGDTRVVHSYDDKTYRAHQTVLIVGDGLTAGTECVNVLHAGSRALALSRRGSFISQALNTPRKYFTRRGLNPFRRHAEVERLAELQRATRGTIKPYAAWRRLFRRAQRDGRLQHLAGELVALDLIETGAVRALIRDHDGHSLRSVVVTQVIIATGFAPASTHPLLQQLIRDYRLPLAGAMIKVSDDFCVPQLSSPESCVVLTGAAAGWAVPCADSLGGLKIVAHTFADLVVGPESWHPRELVFKTGQWLRLLTGMATV